jgi:Flp pilus assembly protein TadD
MGLVLAACAYGAVRRNPPAAMGLLFFISLAPTSSFVPLADAAMEHRMYVPLAFLIAGLVWSLGLLGVAARMRGMSGAGWTRLATALMLGATLALAARTAVRNRDYHDSLSMWAQVVRQRPLNARAHHNLGMMLSAVPQPDLARHHLARSVELKPEDRFMRLNYAMVLARFRVLDEAVRQYEEVLRQSPEDPGLDSLGETSPVAYSNLAVALAQQGRMREAIPAFERVTQLRPGDAPGWYNLGVAYAALGRLEEAKASLGRSLDLRPDYGQAHEAMRKLKQRMEARPRP